MYFTKHDLISMIVFAQKMVWLSKGSFKFGLGTRGCVVPVYLKEVRGIK